jgi:hypothetical protein
VFDTPAVLLACVLGAWVAYDFYVALLTGMAHGKFGTTVDADNRLDTLFDGLVLAFWVGVLLGWLLN